MSSNVIQCFNPYNVSLQLTFQVIDYFTERTNFLLNSPVGTTFYGAINYDTDCSLKNGSNPFFTGYLKSYSNVDNDTTIPPFLGSAPGNTLDQEMYFYTIEVNAFSAILLRVYLCKYIYTISNTPNYHITSLVINTKRFIISVKPDQNCVYMSNNIPVCLNIQNYYNNQNLQISYPIVISSGESTDFQYVFGDNQIIIDGISVDTNKNDILVKNYIINLINNINL
jgi:hypothetical protein